MKTKNYPLWQNTNKEAFIWTDDEVQLLLTVTNEYKVAVKVIQKHRLGVNSKQVWRYT